MFLTLFLFTTFIVKATEAHPINASMYTEEPLIGDCYCALFRNEGASELEEPILLSNRESPVPHNETGFESCSSICSHLLLTTEDEMAETMCEALYNEVYLYVTLYVRICEEEKWSSIHKRNNYPICCQEGKHFDCQIISKQRS